MVAAKPFPPAAASRWVKIYSWITIAAAIYGIAWAHVTFIIGKPWTTCDDGGSVLGCVLTFHLFEAPIVLFNLFIAWYGLKRFSSETYLFRVGAGADIHCSQPFELDKLPGTSRHLRFTPIRAARRA